MHPVTVIVIYSVFVVLSSLLGGFIPAMIRLTHRRMQLVMSGVGGFMLGIGFFHLLPHSLHTAIGIARAVMWLVLGLLPPVLLIRVFGSHSHDTGEGEATACDGKGHAGEANTLHSHEEHAHAPTGSGSYRWVGLGLGLSLHTLLDGVALSAAVLGDASHGSAGLFFGFAVFLGILIHKPLDSLSITALMATGGWSVRWQSIVNLTYALMCPLGAFVFYMGVRNTPQESLAIGCGLAFAAGIFICISLSYLLPELQFHSHDRWPLTILLFLGVSLAYSMKYLEPAHMHGEGATQSLHDHSGHDHSGHDDHDHPSHDHGD